MKSEKIDLLATALCKAQSIMETAPKNATNPFYNSKFANLVSVWDTIRKPLTDNGLSVVQSSDVTDRGMVIRTILLHTSGQYISGDYLITNKDQSPQSYGSAVSYARRYALSAMVGLVSEEDDDGNKASEIKQEQKTKLPNFAPKNDTGLNPSDFVIPFGKKYLGRKLKEIPNNDLKSFADYLKKSDKPSKQGTETLEMINAYLNHGSLNPPNFNDNENIPF